MAADVRNRIRIKQSESHGAVEVGTEAPFPSKTPPVERGENCMGGNANSEK
jgi:hypothetical protein